MAAYADYDDLIAFTDERTVKDLLSDEGNYAGDPRTDAKLTTLFEAASGRVEAACGVSNLYTTAQLAALTGNSLALLKEITCALAMLSIVRRRPEKWGSEYWQGIRGEYEGKDGYLDRLRKGERLFDDDAKRVAGTPSIDGPTAIDLQNLNLIHVRTRNYFPGFGHRLPLGRQ